MAERDREQESARRGRGASESGRSAGERGAEGPEMRERDDVRMSGAEEGARVSRFYARARERSHRSPESGGRNRGRDWNEGQQEFGEGRDPRQGRSYGGARSIGDGYGARGYGGGHRDTSMGGRADYADYSNEPGWDRNYGVGSGRSDQGREGEGRDRPRNRWQREPLTAREIMTRDVRAVQPGSPIREVAEIMRDENTGIVPIVDESRRLLGVITDRDIVLRTIPDGKEPSRLEAGALMTDDVECVTPGETVQDVIRMMGDHQVRRVPVVDQQDRLVGIISLGDIATRADYDEELQEALEEISSRRSFWSRLFS
jgi:CBS domain-containing protein